MPCKGKKKFGVGRKEVKKSLVWQKKSLFRLAIPNFSLSLQTKVQSQQALLAYGTLFNNSKTFFTTMAYKIIDVEGIGPVYAEKLQAAGIKTTEEYLEKCASPAGRKALAEETGISPKLILTWANHADLFRINGIASQFAELLEAAGVDTVKEFRHRVAANLQPKLVEVNEQKNLCNRVPSVSELEKMIAQAKELPAVLTY